MITSNPRSICELVERASRADDVASLRTVVLDLALLAQFLAAEIRDIRMTVPDVESRRARLRRAVLRFNEPKA